MYHGNPLGTGDDTSGVTFNPPRPAWASPHLDGQVYGEPLEATGRVFVATENDTVYALAADSGAILWSTHLGTPVPSGDLPCGDISPTVGITGTPVVDVGRGEIFAVADELVGGVPEHVLVGLNLYTGTSLLAQPVDPPGQDPAAILQRTGLNLNDGNVIFGFGGNAGDCSTYSGWVGSVPEGGGATGYYQTVPIGHDGAVWMGGAAPEVDASGNIWMATGNGSSSLPYDFSDSVLELSPGLARTQFFAPTTWMSDNGPDDLDLGSTAPALLSNGSVLQVGKSSTAYLLNQADLGGISDPPQMPACGSDADGGDAVSGNVVYVPCGSGVQAIQTSPSLSAQWQTSSGAHGPPDHRRRPCVVDRRLGPLRPRPGQRVDGVVGVRRRPGQPLPHPVGGRRAPAGPEHEPGLRLLRLRRDPWAALAPTTGAAELVVLARGVRRRHLHLRQRRLLRFGRQPATGPTRRRHGPDRLQGRLLVGGLRRRHLQLRRRRLPRLDGRQTARTRPSSGWRRRPTAADTGRWPPTAASSASATPPSTAPWAASRSTLPSSAWPPRTTAWGTGWSPPTAASSASATPRSTAPWAART